MSRIRSGDTKPEIALRKALHRSGLRYRVGVAALPGKPDIVLSKYKTVVFVHGCFWHHHENCRDGKIPTSNVDYWTLKFARNMERDRQAADQLRAAGWEVIIVWECELRGKGKLEATAASIVKELTGR